MAKAKKEKPAPGPDDLVRAAAGEYTSGDSRFTVRQSDTNWYVVDNEQSNEFGQELIHGPFATLAKARDAISGARVVKPLLRSGARPRKPLAATAAAKPKPSKPRKPPSWLDKLPAAEASDVRRLIRTLEKEGLTGADDLVRLHRDDRVPTIATRIVENRLAQILDAQPEADREALRELIQRVLTTLTSDGVSMASPTPRWALVELTEAESPAARPIRPRI